MENSIKQISGRRVRETLLNYFSFIGLLIVAVLFEILTEGRLFGQRNIMNIFNNFYTIGLAAMAYVFIMALGELDLSVGAIVGISAAMGALAGKIDAVLFGSALLVAAITGALNGVLRIPSLVLTMGLTMIYEIVGVKLAGSYGYIQLERAYSYLGSAPYIIILFLVSAAGFYFIFNNTEFSYHMRAVGSNEAVAKSTGIHVDRVKFKTFLYGGLFIGMTAMLTISQSGSVGAQSNLGSVTVVFKPLISILLALVLQRICNLTVGIFISQLTLTIIFIGLIALGMPDTSQNVVLGVFLLLVMIFFNNSERIRRFLNRNKIAKVEGGSV